MTGGLRCGRFAFEKAIRSGDTDLSSTAIFAGVMMATWADGDGRNVRPAMETLSAAMGKKSEKTARAAVQELAGGQWLEEVKRIHRRPVEYRLTVPSKFAAFVMTNKPSAASKDSGLAANAPPEPTLPAPAAAVPITESAPPGEFPLAPVWAG